MFMSMVLMQSDTTDIAGDIPEVAAEVMHAASTAVVSPCALYPMLFSAMSLIIYVQRSPQSDPAWHVLVPTVSSERMTPTQQLLNTTAVATVSTSHTDSCKVEGTELSHGVAASADVPTAHKASTYNGVEAQKEA